MQYSLYLTLSFATCVGFQEINDVHISVRRSKEKWEIIGSGLGLSESLLKQIKIDQNNMPDKCLYSALDVWLHGKTNQAVTWRVLLNILKSPEINESVLADKIANKKGIYSVLPHTSNNLVY